MIEHPSLTVRALAAPLVMSAHVYYAVLAEQEYPRGEPQVYKVPYYRPALAAMKRFYRWGRQGAVLDQAISEIEASG